MTRVMVSEALPTPRETRILPRGNWMDDSGAVVEPAIPGFMGELDTGGRRATRLDLANWLVSRAKSADGPRVRQSDVAPVLRHRVVEVRSTISARRASGRRTSSCSTGSPPSSWRRSTTPAGTHAWDMKHLVRTIVTSDTYKQSSAPRPDLEARDPANRLLARQMPLRVDAEVVHDVALQVSGLLAEQVRRPSRSGRISRTGISRR